MATSQNPSPYADPSQAVRYNVLTMVNRADLITEIAAKHPQLDFLLDSTNAIRDSLELNDNGEPELASLDPQHYSDLIAKLSQDRKRIQDDYNLSDKTPLLTHLTNCIHATMAIMETLQDNPDVATPQP